MIRTAPPPAPTWTVLPHTCTSRIDASRRLFACNYAEREHCMHDAVIPVHDQVRQVWWWLGIRIFLEAMFVIPDVLASFPPLPHRAICVDCHMSASWVCGCVTVWLCVPDTSSVHWSPSGSVCPHVRVGTGSRSLSRSLSFSLARSLSHGDEMRNVMLLQVLV